MSNLFQTRLQKLKAPEHFSYLTQIQRGIEKEGLRITPNATIAQSNHPKALGSALTHPSITTDYSEALLEFITPVCQNIEGCLDYLTNLHTFTLSQLDNEYLWPASMPCKLAGDESIPIAQYGHSNIGQMKHAYRQGLANRYGRTMQSIAGIHYNFSMPESFWQHCQQVMGDHSDLQAYKSERYFGLIRNFRRHSWLLIYLFGASPVLDNSFVGDNSHNLDQLSENTLGLPYATSLRMSDLGYQSKAQSNLNISYNNLESYTRDLTQAIGTHYPNYANIGVKVEGQYRQLNSNILQIENEFYSDIRPKRVTKSGETPTAALNERGAEYVEVRILDINPLIPVGIDAEQIRFLDAFLLYCLLTDSPELSEQEQQEIKHNQRAISLEGRKPHLMLEKNGSPISFKVAAKQLLADIKPIAELLDLAHDNQASTSFNTETKTKPNNYSQALTKQVNKIENSELTPSAQLIKETQKGKGYIESMLAFAQDHHQQFISSQQTNELNNELQSVAIESLILQDQIEANEVHNFDDFLRMQYSA